MSKVYGGKLLGSSLLLTLLWLLSLIGKNEAEAASAYYSPSELGATNYEQLNALFKDYLKVLEQVKTQPKHIRFEFFCFKLSPASHQTNTGN